MQTPVRVAATHQEEYHKWYETTNHTSNQRAGSPTADGNKHWQPIQRLIIPASPHLQSGAEVWCSTLGVKSGFKHNMSNLRNIPHHPAGKEEWCQRKKNSDAGKNTIPLFPKSNDAENKDKRNCRQ